VARCEKRRSRNGGHKEDAVVQEPEHPIRVDHEGRHPKRQKGQKPKGGHHRLGEREGTGPRRDNPTPDGHPRTHHEHGKEEEVFRSEEAGNRRKDPP
jgi:hypothetical protein